MKRGQDNPSVTSYLVLIGIVVAILILYPFGNLIAKGLKGNDATSQRYTELAQTVEAISSQQTSLEANTEFVSVRLDEQVLFFDAGSDPLYQVLIGDQYDMAPFANFVMDPYAAFKKIAKDKFHKGTGLLAGENYNVEEYLIDVRIFAYDKPEGCGELACSAICRNDMSADKMAVGEKNRLASEARISGLPDNSYLVKCDYEQVRIYDKVEHFIRKPFLHAVGNQDNMVTIDNGIRKFYFNGAGIFSVTNLLKMSDWPMEEGKTSEAELSDESLDTSIIKEKNQSISLYRDQYVNMQQVHRTVFLCYDYPCLTAAETEYYAWLDSFNACLLDECEAFLNLVKKSDAEIVFKDVDEGIKITKGQTEFIIKNDAKLVLKQTEVEGVEEVSELHIRKEPDQSLAMFKQTYSKDTNKVLLGISYVDKLVFTYYQ